VNINKPEFGLESNRGSSALPVAPEWSVTGSDLMPVEDKLNLLDRYRG
jgi:hypothetical protein